MNKHDYLALLAPIIAEYRMRPYSFWRQAMADQPIVLDVPGANSRECCVEISILWDARPEADIRVIFSIDDGGWRAFVPVTVSFIIAPDGSFVGE